jgi:DNA-binding NarL/FixJ family response regulator
MHALKVLLVDDHDGFRRLLSSFLKKQEGVEVIGEAIDGEDAIAQSENLRPDLVLMDLEMPKTRVVVLSIHGSEVYRRAAREYSADGFIDKNSMKFARRLS